MTNDQEKPRRGRPATGRTTAMVGFRLPREVHEELARRAAAANLSVAEFVERVVGRELRKRPGEGTRKRRKAPPN